MPSNRKRAIKPEDYLRVRNVGDPQLAPDGKRVAHTVTWPDAESDKMRSSVFVATLGGAKPVRFTQGDRDFNPRWSPDGRYLAFLSNRAGEKNQVFLAPLGGGEPRKLTDAPHGVAQPAWSPDGKHIVYVARTGAYKEPKERKGAERNAPRVIRDLRYRLDGIGYFDNRRMHLFVVDVESGETRQITDGDWNDEHPSWSPDGKTIAFVSDRERDRHQRLFNADVYVVPSTGGRARKLTRSKGAASWPQFSPDGRSIAYLGHEHGIAGLAKNSHLLVIPASGGRAPLSLSAPLDRTTHPQTPGNGSTFTWSRDGKSVLFLAADRGAVSLFRAGASNGSVSKLLGGDRQIEAFALTPDGRRAVFASHWVAELPEIYEAPLDGTGRPRALSDANADLRNAIDLQPARRVSYRAPDGLEVETFVIYPRGYRKGRRYPLTLQIHGGPHSYHPMSLPGALVQYQSLAAAGYVVLLPNPRGSQSYGEAFAHAVVGDWAGKDYEEDIAAVDLMIRRGVADPERLYVGGGSYGGYMTAWTVGHTDRFRGAVVSAPAADRVSMFGTTDIPWFSVYELEGAPWDNHGQYVERSPMNYLTNVKTPVLLLHWEGDLRCPIGQSEEIFQTLKMLKKPVEFVRYPGGFHTVRSPSQEVDRTRRVIAWYDAHAPRRAPRRARAPRAKVTPSRNGARPARARAAAKA